MAHPKDLVLLKIGGSSITDKTIPYKLKKEALKRFAKEIAKAKNVNLLIAHGSGSFGHTSASKYGGKKGYVSKIGVAKVFRDAAKINEIVVDALIDEGIPAVSIRPRGFMLAKNGKLNKIFINVIDELLKQKLVPVMCGDVILDSNWNTTIFSGEKSLNILALGLIKKNYNISKIIEVGETKGFEDSKGKTVATINKNNWKSLKKLVYGRRGHDVTGGMNHKVEEALNLSKNRINTYLVSSKPKSLYNAIIGKQFLGTIIK